MVIFEPQRYYKHGSYKKNVYHGLSLSNAVEFATIRKGTRPSPGQQLRKVMNFVGLC